MTPLHASWLVKACCVLHNRCIDWKLRKLRPGQNRDPDLEMEIRVRALSRFRRNNRHILTGEFTANPESEYQPGSTPEGVYRRQLIIQKRYGGPPPVARLPREARRGRGGRGRVGRRDM